MRLRSHRSRHLTSTKRVFKFHKFNFLSMIQSVIPAGLLLQTAHDQLPHVRAMGHNLWEQHKALPYYILCKFFVSGLKKCLKTRELTSEQRLQAQALKTEYLKCLKHFKSVETQNNDLVINTLKPQ